MLKMVSDGVTTDADVLKAIGKLKVFLSPLPLLPNTKMTGFKFPPALTDDLLQLRLALQANEITTKEDAKRVQDTVLKIQSSKTEFFKTFTALGAD